jgi:hypothetical protein
MTRISQDSNKWSDNGRNNKLMSKQTMKTQKKIMRKQRKARRINQQDIKNEKKRRRGTRHSYK